MAAPDSTPAIARAEFLDALQDAVRAARVGESHLGVLLIDVSNLARINHTHGYDTGDQVLAGVYRKLLGVSKLPDTVYRLGSHGFAFLLPGLGNPAFLALALNRVTGLLENDMVLEAGTVSPDINIGVAVNHAGARDAMESLAQAESSLAQVKLGRGLQLEGILQEGGDGLSESRLEQYFVEALRENAFELYYQPKVNLATGRVESAEALLRWATPAGDPVPPELVVTMAESMGRSFELTKWVVHQAMRQLQQWKGRLDIGLALNVQANLVGNPDLGALLRDAPTIWGVEPGRVTVEITEEAIIGDKQAGFDNLLQIRESGIRLSIDDFGTGYSSLSYFKHIPASELKIDKSFVRSLTLDSQDLELVRIMHTIARQFDLAVVAEGVEDRISLDLLRSLGCDYAQGYLFSPPLPPAEFEDWVLAWPGLEEMEAAKA